MTAEDYTPSERLSQALERPAIDGRPLYELVVPHRPIVEDLANVPHGATFVSTRGTAANLALLPRFANVAAVWANPASPELFHVCAGCPQLRALYVAHFKRLREVSLARARALEHLLFNWLATFRSCAHFPGAQDFTWTR